jgi:cytochrome c-type biogenesis protein
MVQFQEGGRSLDLSNPYMGPVYALIAGVLTSASPCALSAIPLVVGHMAGADPSSRRKRAWDLLLFLLGMALALTFVGMIAGFLGKSLILSSPWIRWVAGFAFIVAGASYMGLLGGAKTCSVPLAGGVEGSGSGGLRRGLAGIAMGALYGLSASPCATPALLSILTLVAATGSVTRGAVLLLAYSLGQSVLVAAAGLATAKYQAVLGSRGGQKALALLSKLGGAVIAAFGVYLLLRPYL